jgi:hypothetical protein
VYSILLRTLDHQQTRVHLIHHRDETQDNRHEKNKETSKD